MLFCIEKRYFPEHSSAKYLFFHSVCLYLLKEDLHFAKTALDCLAYGLHSCCFVLAIADQGNLGAGFDACCHYV